MTTTPSRPQRPSALEVARGVAKRLVVSLLPPRGTKLRARLARLKGRLWLLALVPAVWWAYKYWCSAGFLPDWPVYGTFHDLQANAFLNGKLSLPVIPPRELVEAKDPYDRANIRYWMLDASYYRGKYYAYWGPVPALVLAAGKAWFGIGHLVGDQYVAYFFSCLAFWSGALLLERVARRLFPAVGKGLLVLGVLVLAWAHPIPHGVATPGTYLTSIIAGQAWLLLGLVFAFDAVWHAGGPRARRRHLLFTGVAWGLALASRITLAPAIAILALLTVLAVAWASERRWLSGVGSSLVVGLPLAVSLGALLTYNKLRFDQWLEFGTNIQLSAFPIFRVSTEYLLPNFYSYMFRPWRASCQFPYLFQVWVMGANALPDGMTVPHGYMVHEPVIGWLVAAPITWLLPLSFVLAPRPFAASGTHTRAYYFCLVAFSVVASVAGAIAAGVYGATMRYLNDVIYGILLLALMGGFALRSHRIASHVPGVASALFSVLSLATIVIGLLIGYQGYGGHFHRNNPALDAKLVKALSFCGADVPDVPRYMP